MNQPVGKLAREAVHRRPDLGRGVERVGAGALQYLQRDRGFAVEQRTQRIIIGAHFDPGDLTEPGELAVGTSLDDNRSKFFLGRSEEHTSELQSLMRISYAVFCLKKKKIRKNHINNIPKHNKLKYDMVDEETNNNIRTLIAPSLTDQV